MGFGKYTEKDLAPQQKETFDEGWYQLVITKTEPRQAKSTQDMLSVVYRVCDEGAPDAVQGPPIFGIVMFPSWDDDEAFAQAIADKKGIDGDDLEKEIVNRRRQAEDQLVGFSAAVFGYDSFPAVPRKNAETGKYELPDGTEVRNASDRNAMYAQRKLEMINAAIEVATGERDITRYLVFGKLSKSVYNGTERNEVKYVRATLPDGESLASVPF